MADGVSRCIQYGGMAVPPTVQSALAQIHPWNVFLSEIARALHVPLKFLDLETSFVENGGDSMSFIGLKAALSKHGMLVTFESVFAARKLAHLARELL